MRDYLEVRRKFSREALERELFAGSLDTSVNACFECCNRWADEGRVALEWVGRDGARKSVTFAALRENAIRCAHLLARRGIARGDVVASLLPRIPELLTVVLAIWRVGAIYQPLFTAFGPRAIEQRVTAAGGGRAKLIVTDVDNATKLGEVRDCPSVLVIGHDRPGAQDFAEALAGQPARFDPIMLRGNDPFILIFTSGTTGPPKGVLYPLSFLLPVAVYMRDGLDLRPGDRFWNLADPGWGYGMMYTVLGPLLLGDATMMYEGPFSVKATLDVVAKLGITNMAAAPTAYRMLMAAGDAAMVPITGRLRVASSAGEPLNPEVARWAERVLRCPLHDHYGQSELGMLINNHHGLRHAVKLGSAGLAMPGFDLAVLDDQLNPVPPGTPDELAVHRTRSPLFTFSGYWRAVTPSLRGEWYLTGDAMQQDEDGHFYFIGHNDDLITSASYRIGPFEVESAIMEHQAVAEVAVIGKPDPERTEVVKAFIVPRPGYIPSDALAAEIHKLVRSRLSLHAYRREIAFVPDLPKTPSGKVQRFMLRQQA